MSQNATLDYSPNEIRSFLPTGWSLGPNVTARAATDPGRFVAILRDGSDLELKLAVDLEQARTLGRVEALRRAVADLYRTRQESS